ncbi:MAG: DUF2934 domain-containing protein [Actinomycetota bacterium]|nr:DUF2934 domain-containing protein [Actinomycetota bacterium]
MDLHDEIAAVAYELFEARGCVDGLALDDWLNAENIVLARHAGQEIEEPEEEEGEAVSFGEEFAAAGVGAGTRKTDEAEESYPEGMS